MKLNNKGFAISTMMYMILILAVILILATLSILGSRKLILDKQKNEAMNIIYSSNIPNEYQQLEYIESTGTQYIDTNYVPKTNTKLVLQLSFSGNYNASGGISFAGVIDGNIAYSVNFSASQNNVIFAWVDKTYASGATTYGITLLEDTFKNKNLFILRSGLFKYGSQQTATATKTTNQTSTLAVFGRNVDNVITPFSAYNMKLYSFKIYEGDMIMRYYIPCYRKSDDVVGLYDIVNNVFYTNSGTGTFVKGSEI